ncbi:hypothetical protein [Elongatibacter sediminis]|uniref:Uncharacterized protein n=1 Tax=Elongatibacter sediminis TaxID=3119006 RepID=A0AAW9R9V0_9GAMM
MSLVALVSGVALASQPAQAEQTWGYVVGSFSTATYADDESCPEGINPEGKELDRRNLLSLGYTPDEAQKILLEGPASVGADWSILPMRGRIDGKPVNVFTYPESVPDPHIKTLRGSIAYGFNLDGQVTAEDFQDPETGASGIDNQLFRAVGCLQEYHINLPVRPLYEAMMWNYAIDTMPAWLISITGSDLRGDGPVTVRFLKATHHPERDADKGILAGVTYLIADEPDPGINTFEGRIENGMLTVQPGDLRLPGESPILTELDLAEAQLRFRFLPDGGGLQGFVGGYQPWLDFYFMHAALGSANEQSGNDVPGIYYALKRLADADPDPDSGANRRISAAYQLQAMPAFLATREGQVVAVPGEPPEQSRANELTLNGNPTKRDGSSE